MKDILLTLRDSYDNVDRFVIRVTEDGVAIRRAGDPVVEEDRTTVVDISACPGAPPERFLIGVELADA